MIQLPIREKRKKGLVVEERERGDDLALKLKRWSTEGVMVACAGNMIAA